MEQANPVRPQNVHIFVLAGMPASHIAETAKIMTGQQPEASAEQSDFVVVNVQVIQRENPEELKDNDYAAIARSLVWRGHAVLYMPAWERFREGDYVKLANSLVAKGTHAVLIMPSWEIFGSDPTERHVLEDAIADASLTRTKISYHWLFLSKDEFAERLKVKAEEPEAKEAQRLLENLDNEYGRMAAAMDDFLATVQKLDVSAMPPEEAAQSIIKYHNTINVTLTRPHRIGTLLHILPRL